LKINNGGHRPPLQQAVITQTPRERGRHEVKQMFSDSPVRVIGLAASERFDATEAGELNAAIESAKAYAKLSYDVGASGIRIFPNDFH
jgi:hypothetical protein